MFGTSSKSVGVPRGKEESSKSKTKMSDSRASSCLCDAAVRHAVTSTVAADPAGLTEQDLRGGRASFGAVMRAIRTKCGAPSQEICVTSGLSGRLAYIASTALVHTRSEGFSSAERHFRSLPALSEHGHGD